MYRGLFKMAVSLTVLLALVSGIFSAISASQEGIPALIWTNTASDFPTPLAGHTTRQDEFRRDYLRNNADKPGHVLMAFIQDKLSLEDIIDNADVYNEHSTGSKFANLKKMVETHTSVHLPAVFSPGDTIEKLSSTFKGKVHHLKDPYMTDHIVLDSTVPNLIITHLPHNDGKSFEKIDGIIGSLTENLKSMNVPFTAVYTGKTSSPVKPEEKAYTGRHLLATDSASETETYFNSSCILMYYESINLDVTVAAKQTKTYTFQLTEGTATTKCNNGTGEIAIKYRAQNATLTGIVVTMSFKYDKYGYWKTDTTVEYSMNGDGVTIQNRKVQMRSDFIYAPKGFSYHCTDGDPIVQSAKLNDTNGNTESVVQLRIKQFQVQYSAIKNFKFGRPNDCEGFFSIAVLSGLVAGLVLISILSFGIGMIVNISTMDRFDDPKGKTITVNTGD